MGRELGVRYVLEGGVRKAGSRVRITAQLVEATSGAHLWADRFDGRLTISSIFRTRSPTRSSRSSSQASKGRKSNGRGESDPKTSTHTICSSARFHIPRRKRRRTAGIAIRYLEDALRIEPDYTAAHALLSWCYEWCYSRAGFHEPDKQVALRHARTALLAGTDDATALAVAGFVITMLSKDYEAGLSASERALALNPSCATALYLGAATNAFSGRPAIAIAQAQRALRLSPFDLLVYLAYLAQGLAAVQEFTL